jgi:hypothetical protein
MKNILIVFLLLFSINGFSQSIKADSLQENTVFASIKEVKKNDWVAFNKQMSLIQTATDGNWVLGFVWIGNNQPSNTDDAEVSHIVTVNSTVQIQNLNLKAGGVIEFQSGGVLKIGN